LVEVRSAAAPQIADIKEMPSTMRRLEDMQASWTEKAELALSKGREDLAKAALVERQKATDIADGIREDVAELEQVLRAYEADITRLQTKLSEARSRQNAISARMESAITRAKAREVMHGSRTQEALASFDVLERRADFAEGRADALGMGANSLEDRIAELKAAEKVDAELEAMKAALAARNQ
jgi:phage shock protein A